MAGYSSFCSTAHILRRGCPPVKLSLRICGSGYHIMNYDFLTTLTQTEVEKVSLFPYPVKLHVIFCIIAFAFFMLRFIRHKRIYRLILAVAMPISLLIHISDSKMLYYVIGAVELVLLLTAFISSFFDKHVDEEGKEPAAAAETSGESK